MMSDRSAVMVLSDSADQIRFHGKWVVMSTTSVRNRPDIDRLPVYRRPEWTRVVETGRSNTWGHGAVRHPSAAQMERRRIRGACEERPFDAGSRARRIRRRMSSVLGSPGVTLVSLASLVVMLAASPVLTGPDEEAVTPARTATVTVGDNTSLADIAREHVPGASVGDAVARIASLNDLSEFGADGGQGTDAGATRQVVIPVY